MSWTDERPPWLPPLPSANRGRVRIVVGMTLVITVMLGILVVAFLGETLSMYTWWPLAIGLAFLMSGLLSRRRMP
ncbi:hypothetical protein OL239_02260 [Arthrobacter sp. ATA002]|uniref:hypothetical protein n=1 Tax=Arthrobacter sp. ATA002 TaxID=2991715 RepID=UPI0022A6B8F4|nr:hypothetical protein [Arthrobacter sp. ATA002]WAP52154.1 hypothetical protein OL239_02260 [Arthrobacter sp. ATA002]